MQMQVSQSKGIFANANTNIPYDINIELFLNSVGQYDISSNVPKSPCSANVFVTFSNPIIATEGARP